MHSWVVKLVFYLNKLARSIFLTAVRLSGNSEAKKSKIGGVAYFKAKRDSKMSKIYSLDIKMFSYLLEATRSILWNLLVL